MEDMINEVDGTIGYQIAEKCAVNLTVVLSAAGADSDEIGEAFFQAALSMAAKSEARDEWISRFIAGSMVLTRSAIHQSAVNRNGD